MVKEKCVYVVVFVGNMGVLMVMLCMSFGMMSSIDCFVIVVMWLF